MPINREAANQWYDPTSIQTREEKVDVVKCKCGCMFMEQVPVQQVPKMHNVILGQSVPPHRGLVFYVFRCIKCLEVYEPSVQVAARDAARQTYDNFLDQMEGVEKDKDKGDGEVI